jgi:hypothetical protein
VCFPVELLRPENEARLAECHEHVQSTAFRLAPAIARSCSTLLAHHSSAATAEDLTSLDAALDELYVECDRRACTPAATSVPSGAARLLQRSVFMCAVLLLHAALSSAPSPTVRKHAEAALRCLCHVSGGVLAVAELDVLERRLLLDLAASGKLPGLLMSLLDGQGESRPAAAPVPTESTGACRETGSTNAPSHPSICCALGSGSPGSFSSHARRQIPRASPLALRWFATSLSLPVAAHTLAPCLPRLLIRTTDFAPSAAATASVLRSCLGRLHVQDFEERQAAHQLLHGLLEAAAELMRDEARNAGAGQARHAGAGPAGQSHGAGAAGEQASVGDAAAPSAGAAAPTASAAAADPLKIESCAAPADPLIESRAAAAVCSLVFELLQCVAEPLLPSLQHGAMRLVRAAPLLWQRHRCLEQLREAVCASINSARKPGLVRWLLEARAHEAAAKVHSRL